MSLGGSRPTLTRRAHQLAPLALAFSLVTACGDSTDSSNDLFAVGGQLTNVGGQPVPGNARVVVAWVVTSAGPDYTYIYGEGTVQGGSYHITFTAPPPAVALNAGQVGVGIVLLTTGTGLHSGMRLEDAPANTVLLGGTGNYAVIYKVIDGVTRVDWPSLRHRLQLYTQGFLVQESQSGL
ncbi:MAG TPA: hypothetical protein VFJ81_08475 [Gemmatimonadales bacterium]|nr:hypothetical protein [Gemmatimonadales bacterium]